MVLLMPDDLRTIYERTHLRFGEEVWLRLSAHEQTKAVYEEWRLLDSGQNGTWEHNGSVNRRTGFIRHDRAGRRAPASDWPHERMDGIK